ncbi:MAG: UvrD-helicase domain-containing protein, partial [Planctomycetaceae bacterium]|nr:UvrD-helicase domain-containing protein [Planctomycetaceae bacterium]
MTRPRSSGKRSGSRKRSAAETGLLFAEAPEADSTPAIAERPSAARQNLLIRASAGTGKTFQLSGQFIDRLRVTEAERILATTFTRAAAGEILERVLLRLAQAALDPQKLRELGRQVDAWHDRPLTQAECLARLAALTRDLHRVRVGTLDSFFIQLAQSFSLELGLPPGWRILDEIEEQQLVTRAIERLLTRDERGDVGRLLNLIGKGDAGRRVSNVLRQTVRGFYELYQLSDAAAWRKVPEPTPLSADELKQALNDLEYSRSSLPENKHFTNAHRATCQLAGDGDWEDFLGKGFGKAVAGGELTFHRQPIPEPVVAACTQLVSHARAILIRQLASRTSVTWDLLDRFHGELVRLKEEQQGLTFSDVTRALGRGWLDGGVGQLDFRLDATIEHLLLDEFQDTSTPQWQALEPLAVRVAAESGGSLFCVGDQKQAIYGWRGGVSELFESIEQRLPGMQNQPLARSYRSSRAVIDTVNHVFQNLHRHPALGDAEPAVLRWQQRFDLHETERSDLPGCVWLETMSDPDLESEIEFAARRISETQTAMPGATIGVLAIRNDTVAALAQALRRLGVDASEEGGSALGDCVAVQVLLSLFHWLDHPGDTAAWFHVATSPLGAEIGLSPDSPADEAAGLAARLRRELLERGYGPCVSEWSRGLAPHCDERGVARLVQLVDLAYVYGGYATLRPREFVEFVEAQKLVQPSTARVRLMTVHRSKGLEFDVVFLPELDGKLLAATPDFVTGHPTPVEPPDTIIRYANQQVVALLPDDLQQVFKADKERKIEERLCVLYVALTRARHALHMLAKPSSPGAKSLSLSMAHLLRASLTDGKPLAPQSTRVIAGDPEWFKQVPRVLAAVGAEAPTAPVQETPLQITLAPPDERSLARRQAIAPSRHGIRTVRMEEIVKSASSAARTRGVLMHAWFEQITWIDESIPDEAALRRIARKLEPHGLDIDACLSDFRAMLRSGDIAWILSRPAYLSAEGVLAKVHTTAAESDDVSLQVQRERNFAAPLGNEMVRGCIDRLVLLKHGDRVVAADILDFKTDALDGAADESRSERLSGYRGQLRLYARAVQHLYQLPADKVSARLVFLGAERVEEV